MGEGASAFDARRGDEGGIDGKAGHGFARRPRWGHGGDFDWVKHRRSDGWDEDVAGMPSVTGLEGGGGGVVDVPNGAHVGWGE